MRGARAAASAVDGARPLSPQQRRRIARTAGETGTLALGDVPLPSRHHVQPWRRHACLANRPTWLVETARGCPFRCSCCSIWQLHARAVRERSIDAVCQDMAAVGDDVFIADDLFWHHASRSLELAHELRRRGIRKRWILVQSRVDLVARHAQLLEAWRPLADDFDVFFGLEAATDAGLDGLTKDATVDETAQGVDVARRLGYGVTGNFVIDPALGESDFENLRQFVERYQLFQTAFTILTPLPGTVLDDMRACAPQMGALRYAPSALGAGARSRTVLRAVLRNPAALGPEPARPQAPHAVAAGS